MLISLFALACMGMLIIVGCKVNVHLFHAGALGAIMFTALWYLLTYRVWHHRRPYY